MLTFWKEAIEELRSTELENSSECDFLGETTLKTPGEKTSLFHSRETHPAFKQIWLQVSTWKITLEYAARCSSAENLTTNYTLSPNRHTKWWGQEVKGNFASFLPEFLCSVIRLHDLLPKFAKLHLTLPSFFSLSDTGERVTDRI